MAGGHRDIARCMMKDKEPCHPECLGGEVQWGLERAFKGLLAASNDTVRFRRDAALMWRHVESARPALDREGARAMEELLGYVDIQTPSSQRTEEQFERHWRSPPLSDQSLPTVP